jgi:hypothetical protein
MSAWLKRDHRLRKIRNRALRDCLALGARPQQATGFTALSSDVIQMTHTAGHWHESEEEKCIWSTEEKTLTVENHLEYDSVNGRIRLKWFKGRTRN